MVLIVQLAGDDIIVLTLKKKSLEIQYRTVNLKNSAFNLDRLFT